MKKALAGAMLLVFFLSWAPLSLAMAGASHKPAHHCCPRVQSQILLQLPPAVQPCGPQHRCCISSEPPATLPVISQTPQNDLMATVATQPGAPLARERTTTAFRPSVLSFRSLLNVILRI